MSLSKDLLEQAPAELAETAASALASVAKLRGMLPGLVALTSDDRRVQDGRFRLGEARALEAVLDVADAHPRSFGVLSAHDGGDDPDAFESKLLRERLRAIDALVELAEELEHLARDVRDTQHELGSRVRGPVLAGYEIAKSLAKRDESAAKAIAPAVEYYSGPAKARVLRVSEAPPRPSTPPSAK